MFEKKTDAGDSSASISEKVSEIAKNPSAMLTYAKSNSSSLRIWAAFILSAGLICWLCSDFDFSLLLTLSSLVAMFSYVLVIVTIYSTGTVRGVSLRMFECYLVATVSRLISIVPYEGYLPYDRSGDWLYQTAEVFSLFLIGGIVHMCRMRFASTYNANADSSLNHLYLIAVTFVLALIFHPGLNSFMPADVAWTFALYLEALAVIPQLLMFQTERRVEEFTTHFLMAQAIARLLSFIFWASSFSELNDTNKFLKSHVGYWILLMQFCQLLVMADFVYCYIKCLAKGVPVQQSLFAEDV